MRSMAAALAGWLGLIVCVVLSATPVHAEEAAPADLREEVRRMRQELDALRQDMQAIKQALSAARRGGTGWEKVDPSPLDPEDSPMLGSADAPLVLVEFSDYQCPYCGRHFAETFPQIKREFVDSGKLRYLVAEMPLERIHPLALKAAQAARCAGDQGKFWEMHARLFSKQRELEPWSAHAQAVGVDETRFGRCMEDESVQKRIRANVEGAVQAGVSSTPTFLLAKSTDDGLRVVRRLRGAAPYSMFKSEIEAALAEVGR
ncbi:MAG: thioredoxin domain-containing protein [Betaproteobacteria bacterium]|nr:thioredoxin domain-containing protein [Betaproteobacteria bacterium]